MILPSWSVEVLYILDSIGFSAFQSFTIIGMEVLLSNTQHIPTIQMETNKMKVGKSYKAEVGGYLNDLQIFSTTSLFIVFPVIC